MCPSNMLIAGVYVCTFHCPENLRAGAVKASVKCFLMTQNGFWLICLRLYQCLTNDCDGSDSEDWRPKARASNTELLVTASEMYVTLTQWCLMFIRHPYPMKPDVHTSHLPSEAWCSYVTLIQWSLFIRHTYPVKPDVHTSHLPSEAWYSHVTLTQWSLMFTRHPYTVKLDVHTSHLPSEAWCSYVTLTQWSLMFIRHTYPVKLDVYTSHLSSEAWCSYVTITQWSLMFMTMSR